MSSAAVVQGQNNVLLGGPQADIVIGSWTPVDIKDQYVQELGRFAVMEHDKKSGEHLIFEKVVGGFMVESSIDNKNYYNLLVVTNNGLKCIMNGFNSAIVCDIPAKKEWKLVAFVRLN